MPPHAGRVKDGRDLAATPEALVLDAAEYGGILVCGGLKAIAPAQISKEPE
jgi:hypothetical protein